MNRLERKQLLTELVERHGLHAVREKLGITERTLNLYLHRDNYDKMVPYFRLRRAQIRLEGN